MSTPGTIGRPAPHEPVTAQTTLTDTLTQQAGGAPIGAGPDAALPRRKQNRNRTLHLIQEALARSHMEDRLREAAAQRKAHRLVLADRLHRRSLRLQRRAERTSQRARRALAQALTQ